MKRVSMYMGVMAAALAFSVVPGHAQNKDKDKNTADRTANMGGMGQDRVTREVRHELVMLPYYGGRAVFGSALHRAVDVVDHERHREDPGGGFAHPGGPAAADLRGAGSALRHPGHELEAGGGEPHGAAVRADPDVAHRPPHSPH